MNVAYEMDLITAWKATDFGLGTRTSRTTCDEVRNRMTSARLSSLRAERTERTKLFGSPDTSAYDKFQASQISTQPCRNPELWEPWKCLLFSRRTADHDRALISLLNMSTNSEFLLVNAPPDLLDLLLASIGIYDSYNRRRACGEYLENSSVGRVFKMFFEKTIIPGTILHVLSPFADVLLLWAMNFDAYGEKCRMITEQMASDDDVDVKVSAEFLKRMEKCGIGVEETLISAKTGMNFSGSESLLYSKIGKKYEIVLAILKNLSASKFNRVIIAQQKNALRLCLLMAHCTWKNLRLIALDLLSSIADFMYFEPPLENSAQAALFLVVKNGVKSQQTFVVQKCINIIRKWMFCSTAGPKPVRHVNFALLLPFLDLPDLVVRLESVLFAPEREMLVDSLSILLLLMTQNSRETDAVKAAIKSSTDLIRATSLLIFARETDFSQTQPIVLGLDNYLVSVLDMIKRIIATETRTELKYKLCIYGQKFSSFLKDISANPHHRLSYNELELCGWAMKTFRQVAPPPFLEKMLAKESIENVAFRNRIYLPYSGASCVINLNTRLYQGEDKQRPCCCEIKKSIYPHKVTINPYESENASFGNNYSETQENPNLKSIPEQTVSETPLSVIGKLVYDSVVIETGYNARPSKIEGAVGKNEQSNSEKVCFTCGKPETQDFHNLTNRSQTQQSQLRQQPGKRFLSYASSSYSYPPFVQISTKSDYFRAFFEFPKGYFPGSTFSRATTRFDYKRTIWNKILHARASECGEGLGKRSILPFSSGQKTVGPVCTAVVRLAAGLLKSIAEESQMSRKFIKGLEPQLAFLIACDEDYSPCIADLMKLFESMSAR